MRVVAYFDSADQVERAGRIAEGAGWRVIGAAAPAFNDRVLHAAHATRSPVAVAGLIGGAVGVLAGVLLTVGTVRTWPVLIVGGKPLIAVPPFLIIVFELAVLGASIAAIGSFLVAAAAARRMAAELCDAATSDDRLSLLMESTPGLATPLDDLIGRLMPAGWRRT